MTGILGSISLVENGEVFDCMRKCKLSSEEKICPRSPTKEVNRGAVPTSVRPTKEEVQSWDRGAQAKTIIVGQVVAQVDGAQ